MPASRAAVTTTADRSSSMRRPKLLHPSPATETATSPIARISITREASATVFHQCVVPSDLLVVAPREEAAGRRDPDPGGDLVRARPAVGDLPHRPPVAV